MNTEETLNTPLTQQDVEAMAITASVELASRWLQEHPKAIPHIQAGAGVVLETTLTPVPAIRLLLVDSDGKRYVMASKSFATLQ